ncbi:hypothetical protein Theam_1604 [Thermovibrio ammonificans HB-1]|jgi:hypothetical protein|uniref:ATP synthase I n=1 Tax=Thermovibrio ammonificans (strain DSM 15698 / JCM 12110 / HB-1) TaxID=648996 RepID=E8T529_THEA1|nr:hypothetical protein [Thermovibrio ammonificans]ADU97561.1 hypothetical protein Theam_1604 [Thermovibrio ammonificans HB-1]
MREFELFLKRLLVVEGAVFILTFMPLLLVKGWSVFTYSYLLGYAVMAYDYYQLVKFSRRLPQQVQAGVFPKSGFAWRFISILLILVGLSLFTRLNFFAIISAVVATNAALILTVLLHRKEWRRWNTQQ